MKQCIGVIIISISVLLSPLCPVAHADHIIIAADLWCPINCDPESDAPGIMVEIAQEVFSRAGHTVEYHTMPWARAIHAARHGAVTGIIGAFKGDAPDFIFPDNELAKLSGSALFAVKNFPWRYQGISSLQEVRLGAILHYDYGEEASAYIEEFQGSEKIDIIAGEDALERNIEKLLAGRIDVVIEAQSVFLYTARNMGVKDRIQHVGQISKAEDLSLIHI